jgi:hypothetical protein
LRRYGSNSKKNNPLFWAIKLERALLAGVAEKLPKQILRVNKKWQPLKPLLV